MMKKMMIKTTEEIAIGYRDMKELCNSANEFDSFLEFKNMKWVLKRERKAVKESKRCHVNTLLHEHAWNYLGTRCLLCNEKKERKEYI